MPALQQLDPSEPHARSQANTNRPALGGACNSATKLRQTCKGTVKTGTPAASQSLAKGQCSTWNQGSAPDTTSQDTPGGSGPT